MRLSDKSRISRFGRLFNFHNASILSSLWLRSRTRRTLKWITGREGTRCKLAKGSPVNDFWSCFGSEESRSSMFFKWLHLIVRLRRLGNVSKEEIFKKLSLTFNSRSVTNLSNPSVSHKLNPFPANETEGTSAEGSRKSKDSIESIFGSLAFSYSLS